MNIPYRTRRRLARAGTVLLALVLVFIVVWFCWVVWIERYVVYTREGAQLDLELSANEMEGEVATPPVAGSSSVSIYFNEGENAIDTSNALKQLSGYFIDIDDLTGNLAEVWDIVDRLPSGTTVMIDMKGGYGSFYYSTTLSEAIISKSVSVASVDELISYMKKEKGFYLIARVSAFRDYNYGLNHVEQGLYMLSRAGLWADAGGCYWLDPTNASVLSWISSIVNELKEVGFNEVVLTDFCFPDSDKYIFNGDKDAALQSAANTLMTNCGSTSFTLSFAVKNAAFPLPEGRSRLYLENVEPANIGAKISQVTVEEPEVHVVFVAETNDTRFDAYSVLRPISVADILEAQKANTNKTTKTTTATTPSASTEATAAPETSGAVG